MTEMNTGPVGFEDVRQALGDQDPASTNAGALRRILGRGSLSTIQRHLDALRAQAVQPAEEVVGEVPKPPADLVQSLWAQAWAQAQALVQTALAAALAKCEALGQALGMAQADAVAAQAEADQARDELGAVVARLEGLDGQHKAAIDQIQAAHQEQVLALRAGISEARTQAEQARHELAVAQARHAADLAVLRGELDRQVSQLADLRAALQRPLPALEPVLSKQESGAS
jgi:predicted  nucleic acid-binding Zn-ribbon protein